VNYTPDGYVLTVLLPISISLVDAAAVRSNELQAQQVRGMLESYGVPMAMVIIRSSEGVLFAAG
jgi:hypothetical protein